MTDLNEVVAKSLSVYRQGKVLAGKILLRI